MHPQGGDNGERGASLVEFALLVPVLFLILLGTITGGLTLSRQNSVENAVREATRFGAILPDFNDVDNRKDIYAQVKSAATGDLDNGTPGREICIALIDPAPTPTDATAVKWDYAVYAGTDVPTEQNVDADTASVPPACTSGIDLTVGVGTRRIWVRASRTSDIKAILYAETVTIESRSMTRYER